MRRKVLQVLLVSLAAVVGSCSSPPKGRAPVPLPRDFTPTRIDYVDSDGFDALLESALVNQDPVIVIQTGHGKPEWGGRLNAWIAAWNRGGGPPPGATFRMQAPFLPRVDAETLREFRLLIDDLMGRVEERVKESSAWWTQEKVRNRRVELLRPYNLRFHMGEDGLIQIILFNGRYAQYHEEFTRALAGEEDSAPWQRDYKCSWCKRARAAAGAPEPPAEAVP
jgi:hypothetical protein